MPGQRVGCSSLPQLAYWFGGGVLNHTLNRAGFVVREFEIDEAKVTKLRTQVLFYRDDEAVTATYPMSLLFDHVEDSFEFYR